MNRKASSRTLVIAALAVTTPASPSAEDLRRLTLPEAVHLAISQNRALKIARLKVNENRQKQNREHAGYFPELTNQSNALHITDLQFVDIPAGTFGTVAGIPIPKQQIPLPQGKLTFYSSGTQISQPLTQVIRIRQANRMAAADSFAYLVFFAIPLVSAAGCDLVLAESRDPAEPLQHWGARGDAFSAVFVDYQLLREA